MAEVKVWISCWSSVTGERSVPDMVGIVGIVGWDNVGGCGQEVSSSSHYPTSSRVNLSNPLI
jgi:hypothetical protein